MNKILELLKLLKDPYRSIKFYYDGEILSIRVTNNDRITSTILNKSEFDEKTIDKAVESLVERIREANEA